MTARAPRLCDHCSRTFLSTSEEHRACSPKCARALVPREDDEIPNTKRAAREARGWKPTPRRLAWEARGDRAERIRLGLAELRAINAKRLRREVHR